MASENFEGHRLLLQVGLIDEHQVGPVQFPLLPFDHAGMFGLDRRDLEGMLALVGLARSTNAVVNARVHQRIEDSVLHLDRVVQFVAKLADEIDPHRDDARGLDRQPPRSEPRERFVGDIDVGDLRQHLTRARASEHQHAALRRHLVDAHTIVGWQEFFQRVEIMRLKRSGGDEIKTFGPDAG